MTYWNIGKRIVENEQQGSVRAVYGKRLTKILADDLSREFGNSYSQRNLEYYRKFFILFNDLEILNACVQNLNWTHFRALLRVADEEARIWYMREAVRENWSSRTLDRNIGTQYYYRLLHSPSVLHDNDRLFMTKYMTVMPTQEQLKIEIEKQKAIFYAQHPEAEE